MAIIFVSIKKRQQVFFWGISLLSLAGMAALAFLVLLPELQDAPDVVVQEVFSAPDVDINFDLIDSAQVKNLEPFSPAPVDSAAPAGRDNPFEP